MTLRIALCDTDSRALAAWNAQFSEVPDVEIREESILETDADVILLPGNSFGYLESGLALEATEKFGMELQDTIRSRIGGEFGGELLVGQAIDVALPEPKCLLVYAPVWRVPESLADSVNVFLAVRATFLTLDKQASEASISTLAIPALGLDPGGMHPYVSARQIRYAYEIFCLHTRGASDKNLTRLRRRERKLKSVPSQAFATGESPTADEETQ